MHKIADVDDRWRKIEKIVNMHEKCL